jgi:hypothetical protein
MHRICVIVIWTLAVITSYGYNPSVSPVAAAISVHGNNERIGIDAFNQGVDLMIETVDTFVTR